MISDKPPALFSRWKQDRQLFISIAINVADRQRTILTTAICQFYIFHNLYSKTLSTLKLLMQFIFLQSILSFPDPLRHLLSSPWKFLQDHHNAKAPFYVSYPTFRSLQLKSKLEGVQLSLYSLKHDQEQSLQEAEHPCQQQQHSLSLKCCILCP